MALTRNYFPWIWFAVGLDDHGWLPPSVRLRAVSYETVYQGVPQKHRALINAELDEEEESSSEVRARVSESPWVYITEKLTRDLISALKTVKWEMAKSPLGPQAIKHTLAARFCKITFRESSVETATEDLNSEHALRKLTRDVNTNIPKSFADYVIEEGAEKIGFKLKGEGDVYVVTLRDLSRLYDAETICKCRAVGEDRRLKVFKLEFNHWHHLTFDISCLEENVDLRVSLTSKRDEPTDGEIQDIDGIQDIIDSAIIDPGTGALRWPNEDEPSWDKFTVKHSSRVKTKIYVNSRMKLKVVDCDRLYFGKSAVKSSREVYVVLRNVTSKLKERDVDANLIKEMLGDDLKCLWGSLFRCESFLKW